MIHALWKVARGIRAHLHKSKHPATARPGESKSGRERQYEKEEQEEELEESCSESEGDAEQQEDHNLADIEELCSPADELLREEGSHFSMGSLTDGLGSWRKEDAQPAIEEMVEGIAEVAKLCLEPA